MNIVQRKRNIQHSFTLYDEYFNFSYVDKSGSGDHNISYANFPKKSSIQIEQNSLLRILGYLFSALAMHEGITATLGQALNLSIYLWITLSISCLIAAQLSFVKYTVFRTEQGNVFVINDDKHDVIIDEITRRKKTLLLKKYGDVDPNNELENEIEKFRWLAEQDIISAEEREVKIAQAEIIKSQPGGESMRGKLN